MSNLLSNWKTTSAGILSIAASIVHLVFSIKNGHNDESVWMTAITGILIGVGLLAAGDASKSKEDVAKVDRKLDQTVVAVSTGDTSILPNPTPSKPLAPPPDK